jgi:hypothetical protein
VTDEQEPKQPSSVIQGTIAQLLGASLASTVVLGLASAKIYLAAGFESAFGSLLSIIAYLCFRGLRRK